MAMAFQSVAVLEWQGRAASPEPAILSALCPARLSRVFYHATVRHIILSHYQYKYNMYTRIEQVQQNPDAIFGGGGSPTVNCQKPSEKNSAAILQHSAAPLSATLCQGWSFGLWRATISEKNPRRVTRVHLEARAKLLLCHLVVV
jgi:hypothetical protein